MKILIFAALLFLFFSSLSYSKTCVRYDRNGHKIYYACPKQSERKYHFKWDETTTRQGNKITNKKIVISTVCAEYGKGSIDYRRCRNQAKELFEKRCDSLGYDSRIDKEMYCDAELALRYER